MIHTYAHTITPTPSPRQMAIVIGAVVGGGVLWYGLLAHCKRRCGRFVLTYTRWTRRLQHLYTLASMGACGLAMMTDGWGYTTTSCNYVGLSTAVTNWVADQYPLGRPPPCANIPLESTYYPERLLLAGGVTKVFLVLSMACGAVTLAKAAASNFVRGLRVDRIPIRRGIAILLVLQTLLAFYGALLWVTIAPPTVARMGEDERLVPAHSFIAAVGGSFYALFALCANIITIGGALD